MKSSCNITQFPSNRVRLHTALCLTFLFLGFLLCMGRTRQVQESLAARLAPSILRFHILANSDSREDQNIKLEIRSLILNYMQKQENAGTSKETTIRWMNEHKKELTALADAYLKEHGFRYRSGFEITNAYFPARAYGRFLFPCGNYDAVRITLGAGDGHNWWCVLYPRFCFVDAVCSEVPAESEAVLRQNLKEGDYLALEDRRPDFKIRFKLLSWLNP